MEFLDKDILKLPAESVDPRLKPIISASLREMDLRRRRRIILPVHNSEYRRCNRCGIYHKKDDTILRKYHPHSTRKYRLCYDCSLTLPSL